MYKSIRSTEIDFDYQFDDHYHDSNDWKFDIALSVDDIQISTNV